MKMLNDGTLVVDVADATSVTRVLVEDEHKNGCLYYADRPKGEWIVVGSSLDTIWEYVPNVVNGKSVLLTNYPTSAQTVVRI